VRNFFEKFLKSGATHAGETHGAVDGSFNDLLLHHSGGVPRGLGMCRVD
jgi:hypothetical protein